jgi:hypothetical protein
VTPSLFSLSIEVIDYLIGLLVGDHALVSAFHLVEEYDVHVGLGTLTEASGHHKAVEQVIVRGDVLELVERDRGDEVSPEAGVLQGRHY